MKNDRQAMILEIISQENIETQEQLLTRLRDRGLRCTQATISRDIKQLHLIKEPMGQGVYKYAVSGNRTTLNVAAKLRTIFRECIVSIDYAQNIVVVKTMPGLANGACSALDNMDMNNIVGSLAGDDTALLVMRNTEAAELLSRRSKICSKRRQALGDKGFSIRAWRIGCAIFPHRQGRGPEQCVLHTVPKTPALFCDRNGRLQNRQKGNETPFVGGRREVSPASTIY